MTLMITNTGKSRKSEVKLFSSLRFMQGYGGDVCKMLRWPLKQCQPRWGKMSLQATACSCTGFHWGQTVGSVPSSGWCLLPVHVPQGWTAACCHHH